MQIVLGALVAAGVAVLAPRVIHAHRVHEAKAWCEELARQIKEKYGPAGPPEREYGELFIDVSEFESTMPDPPALIPRPGATCRRYRDSFRVRFGWIPSPWTDSPWDPHIPNGSVGWSFDSLSEEWRKTGYFGPD